MRKRSSPTTSAEQSISAAGGRVASTEWPSLASVNAEMPRMFTWNIACVFVCVCVCVPVRGSGWGCRCVDVGGCGCVRACEACMGVELSVVVGVQVCG